MTNLTEVQEWVLREAARVCEELRQGMKPKPARTGMSSTALNQRLYRSDLNRYKYGGQRWSSVNEAANPHISALVKKGLMERPDRGAVQVTNEGYTWLKQHPKN